MVGAVGGSALWNTGENREGKAVLHQQQCPNWCWLPGQCQRSKEVSCGVSVGIGYPRWGKSLCICMYQFPVKEQRNVQSIIIL